MPNIDASYWKGLVALLPLNMRAAGERLIVAIQEQKGAELANYVTIEQYLETEHGDLDGLTDDDHPQYHNDTRGDARYSLNSHTHAADPARSVVTKTADYTITDADYTVLADGTITLTLPAAISGTVYEIKNIGSGAITVKPDGTEEIEDDSSAVLACKDESITITSDGTGWYIV